MNSHSVALLLLLVAVIAAIVLFAARRVRREQAQEKAAEQPKAPRSHQPPAVKVKLVEGGGLWEAWASVPPPRAEPKREKPETPSDAKGSPSDPKDH
jgi:hypothetical protein